MSDQLVVAFNSVVAGGIAGGAAKVFEYPLDTVKVQIQAGKAASLGVAVRDSIAAGGGGLRGCRALYAGMSSPLAGALFESSAVFFFYEQAALLWKDEPIVPMHGVLLSGACGGLGTTLVLTPVERVKVISQTTNESALTVARRLVAEGGFRSLARGLTVTAAREVPGNLVWFGAYEGVTRSLRRFLMPDAPVDTPLPASVAIAGGAAAGAAYWGVPYPLDTIKTRLQTNDTHTFRSAAASIAAEGGIRAFYRGAGITIARAMPSNAIVFVVYNWVTELLKKATHQDV